MALPVDRCDKRTQCGLSPAKNFVAAFTLHPLPRPARARSCVLAIRTSDFYENSLGPLHLVRWSSSQYAEDLVDGMCPPLLSQTRSVLSHTHKHPIKYRSSSSSKLKMPMALARRRRRSRPPSCACNEVRYPYTYHQQPSYLPIYLLSLNPYILRTILTNLLCDNKQTSKNSH